MNLEAKKTWGWPGGENDGSPSLERSALTTEHLSLDRLGWAQPVNTPLRSGMRLVLVGYSISLSHLAVERGPMKHEVGRRDVNQSSVEDD